MNLLQARSLLTYNIISKQRFLEPCADDTARGFAVLKDMQWI